MYTTQTLLRRGLALEYATLGWNVVGAAILIGAAVAASSVALAGFGVDSRIEIIASTVVVWQLKGGQGSKRERRALRIIAAAFLALAIYIAAQSAITLAPHAHPKRSTLGIAWLAATAVAMFALAAGKRDVGTRLDNRVLRTEARVTLIDGALAAAVLTGNPENASAPSGDVVLRRNRRMKHKVALGRLDGHAHTCVIGAEPAQQNDRTEEMAAVGRLLSRG